MIMKKEATDLFKKKEYAFAIQKYKEVLKAIEDGQDSEIDFLMTISSNIA